MQPISTKTGDAGETSLANGERLEKSDPIFDVLGTQDELNSWIGLVLAKLPGHFDAERQLLLQIQKDLFYLGAELAKSPTATLPADSLSVLEQQAFALQEAMGENWTTKFLYPGGNEVAALLDIARAVSRRFERVVMQYAKTVPVAPKSMQYVNRLSDYLYVLRCYVNAQEKYVEKKFER